jgi:hypothetical protein
MWQFGILFYARSRTLAHHSLNAISCNFIYVHAWRGGAIVGYKSIILRFLRLVQFFPKWQNFAQSGHPARSIHESSSSSLYPVR